MERPKLYLDLNLYCCAFNDQTQLRLYHEARAVDVILNQANRHVYEIYWSYVLDMENSLNQNLIEHRIVIRQSTFCRHSILPANDIQLLASRIRTLSAIKGYDAEHIACAELTECDYLLTGDDRLLRQFNHLKAQRVLPLRVVLQNPVDFLRTQLEEEKSRER
jgi:predicted nucleic acid-binding protein